MIIPFVLLIFTGLALVLLQKNLLKIICGLYFIFLGLLCVAALIAGSLDQREDGTILGVCILVTALIQVVAAMALTGRVFRMRSRIDIRDMESLRN